MPLSSPNRKDSSLLRCNQAASVIIFVINFLFVRSFIGNKVFGIICPLFLFLIFVLFCFLFIYSFIYFFSPPLFVPFLFPFSPVDDSLEGSLIPYSDYRGQDCHLPGFSSLFFSFFFFIPFSLLCTVLSRRSLHFINGEISKVLILLPFLLYSVMG